MEHGNFFFEVYVAVSGQSCRGRGRAGGGERLKLQREGLELVAESSQSCKGRAGGSEQLKL